jgi:hypothetical protein
MNWPLIIFGGGLGASAFAYLLRLVVFDRLDRVEKAVAKSAESQGKRIGDLESWTEAHDRVEEYKARRSLSRAHGIPIPDQEDQTP